MEQDRLDREAARAQEGLLEDVRRRFRVAEQRAIPTGGTPMPDSSPVDAHLLLRDLEQLVRHKFHAGRDHGYHQGIEQGYQHAVRAAHAARGDVARILGVAFGEHIGGVLELLDRDDAKTRQELKDNVRGRLEVLRTTFLTVAAEIRKGEL